LFRTAHRQQPRRDLQSADLDGLLLVSYVLFDAHSSRDSMSKIPHKLVQPAQIYIRKRLKRINAGETFHFSRSIFPDG
jgi:hypothetical protein